MTPPTTEPWQNLATPPEDAVTAPWWAGTRERTLLVQTCVTCGSAQHPPRSVCVACMSAELGWTPVSGRATVDSFTVVHRAPHPGLEVPYVLARVRLTEGPILLTRIVDVDPAHPDAVRCDQPVTLAWVGLTDGRALPVFRPIPQTGDASPAPTSQER